MTTGFIPDELFSICTDTVKQYHQKNGFGNLSARISTDDNINIIASVPEASTVLDSTNRYYKIRKFCFLASIGIVCLAWLIPWWTLSVIVVIFLADRILAVREKDGWKFLASILLSLEMLSNDYSGWGKAHPQERSQALRILKDNPESAKSAWLDFYQLKTGDRQ